MGYIRLQRSTFTIDGNANIPKCTTSPGKVIGVEQNFVAYNLQGETIVITTPIKDINNQVMDYQSGAIKITQSLQSFDHIFTLQGVAQSGRYNLLVPRVVNYPQGARLY